MLANLFRDSEHLPGERCSLKRRADRSGIGEPDAWFEAGIQLDVRRA